MMMQVRRYTKASANLFRVPQLQLDVRQLRSGIYTGWTSEENRLMTSHLIDRFDGHIMEETQLAYLSK